MKSDGRCSTLLPAGTRLDKLWSVVSSAKDKGKGALARVQNYRTTVDGQRTMLVKFCQAIPSRGETRVAYLGHIYMSELTPLPAEKAVVEVRMHITSAPAGILVIEALDYRVDTRNSTTIHLLDMDKKQEDEILRLANDASQ